jgi:aldose 1-epimerase
MIELARGAVALAISPDLGGSVMRFDFEGRPVMRPAPAGATNPLDCCSFPLVPYANRIEHGVLKFEGREYRLPLNFGDHPHALHGHGWQTAWRVETVSKDRASIAFDHAPDAWPWAYTAVQEFGLTSDGARIRMTVRNRDGKPMPISLGFHPYFPRYAGSRLTARIAGMWQSDSTMIPTVHVDGSPLLDLAGGAMISKAPFVDNCFTGWHPPARIGRPGHHPGSFGGMPVLPCLCPGRDGLFLCRARHCDAQRVQSARTGWRHGRASGRPRREPVHRNAHRDSQTLIYKRVRRTSPGKVSECDFLA